MTNNQREFCFRVGIPYWSWAEVKLKRRDFPLAYLQLLCNEYNLNPEYILHGSGTMFKENMPPYPKRRPGVKRIFIKDIEVTKEPAGILIKYTDFKGELYTFEYINV